MSLEAAYTDGQFAALVQLKLAFPAVTHPVVEQSATLQSRPTKGLSPAAKQKLEPPTNPFDISQLFSVHEQAETRTEPRRKLSTEMCTSCRKDKHYGPCSKPRPIPTKAADFNMNLRGDDPSTGDNPSTSPHYHSATSDSSLARARDARPADEQAGTAFADLFRHLGISNSADEPGRMTGGLNKVAGIPKGLNQAWQEPFEGAHTAFRREFPFYRAGAQGHGRAIAETLSNAQHPLTEGTSGFLDLLMRGAQRDRNIARSLIENRSVPLRTGPQVTIRPKIGDWQLWGTDGHSMHEQRGTPINPYEERLTIKTPPAGWGDEGAQRIRRSFDQIDGAADSTSIEDASKGAPSGGPAVLG